MLAFLGLSMVVVFTYLIMAKRLSPIVALIVVPVVFSIIGGFALTTDKMMLDGIKMVAPSAALLLFAILFFGVLFDAGLFDPMIKFILKLLLTCLYCKIGLTKCHNFFLRICILHN